MNNKLLLYLMLIAIFLNSSADLLSNEFRHSKDEKWSFSITIGNGEPVCEAYLKRLNDIETTIWPFCDRPEGGEEYGFTILNRVPLSIEEVQVLDPRVNGFTGHKNQDLRDLINSQMYRLGRDVNPEPLESIKKRYGTGVRVWRYSPPIDIDNDGKLDNLIIWHGVPAGASSLPGCGHIGYKFSDRPARVTQTPLLLEENNKRIDVFNTTRIFTHPLNGYKIYEGTPKETFSDKYRPVGSTIGVFKYGDTYYFDTFFNGWGDFQGKRRKDPEINNVLGVFLYKGWKTKQICEYKWNNSPKYDEKNERIYE